MAYWLQQIASVIASLLGLMLAIGFVFGRQLLFVVEKPLMGYTSSSNKNI